jgi:hypothetical protein
MFARGPFNHLDCVQKPSANFRPGRSGGPADYFDIHLGLAPKEGATLERDSIVLVAGSLWRRQG